MGSLNGTYLFQYNQQCTQWCSWVMCTLLALGSGLQALWYGYWAAWEGEQQEWQLRCWRESDACFWALWLWHCTNYWHGQRYYYNIMILVWDYMTVGEHQHLHSRISATLVPPTVWWFLRVSLFGLCVSDNDRQYYHYMTSWSGNYVITQNSSHIICNVQGSAASS